MFPSALLLLRLTQSQLCVSRNRGFVCVTTGALCHTQKQWCDYLTDSIYSKSWCGSVNRVHILVCWLFSMQLKKEVKNIIFT
jgi:hypothetical protein